MAVVRQTQRVFNKPIGVTRMNTGEAELWQTVSNAASTINNIAMDYEKTVGVSQAQEAALGVARDDVISIDPSTGKPVALKIAEQYGSIRARAFTDIINRRFEESISNEITTKGIDFANKYPSSAVFNEEMSRYIQDLVDSSNGMYSEFIQETGTVYIAKATKTLQSAERAAAKSAAKNAAEFTKQVTMRKAIELSAAGGDSVEIDAQFKIAQTAIEDDYKLDRNVSQYFASMDELNLARAKSSIGHLQSVTAGLTKSQILTISAAIENPLSLGLLGDELAEYKSLITSIHSNANYQGLEKLSTLFDGQVSDQESINIAEYNEKTQALLDSQNPTTQYHAHKFHTSNVSNEAVVNKDNMGKASMRLPARLLSKTVISFLASSTTDNDKKIITAVLGSLNSLNSNTELLKQIPDTSIKNDVKFILSNYTPEQINILVADIDRVLNDAANLDTETKAEEKAAKTQLRLAKEEADARFVLANQPAYLEMYGALLGELNIETDKDRAMVLAQELYDHVANADPRLVSNDHRVKASNLLSSKAPSLKNAQAKKGSALKTNEAIRLISLGINNNEIVGESAFDRIDELREIVEAAELTNFHTDTVINSWYKQIDDLAIAVKKNNKATIFQENNSALQSIISLFKSNAAKGIVDEQLLTNSLKFINQFEKSFPTEFNATSREEAKSILMQNHSTAISTVAIQDLTSGTNSRGLSPKVIDEAIAVGRSGIDAVNSKYGDTNTVASKLARTIAKISGTPSFASNLNTIIGTIKNTNDGLWQTFTEEQNRENAVARVENGTGSPADADIYVEERLDPLVDGPVDYQDQNLWQNEFGQLSAYSQEFIKLANLGHLPKSFKNLMVSMATGGVSGNETILNVINALNNADTNGKPINILTQMPNLTDQESDAAVRLSYAQDLAEFSQQTLSEALATILGRESEMKMSINDYSKDVLDAKIPEWVAETWPDADLKSRTLLRFATKEAFIQGASTAEDVKSRVQYYIDNHFVEDQDVIGPTVDGKVSGGRQLLPDEITFMNAKINAALAQSFSPEEQVKFLKTVDMQPEGESIGPLFGALSGVQQTFYNILSGDKRVDLEWKLKPNPTKYGLYDLMILTEAGTYVQRTHDVELEGNTIKVPMSFDVIDYRGKTSTAHLNELYTTRLQNAFKENNGNSFSTFVNSRNVFIDVEGFGHDVSDDEAKARSALLFVRDPSLLEENENKQIFFDLVDEGYIDEAHVPIFFEGVTGIQYLPSFKAETGIQPFARVEKITRENTTIPTEIGPDNPQPPATISMVMNNFKLNMRNTTEAEWKGMSKEQRTDAGLPTKLPIPGYFITSRFFKPTPQSSNWRKRFHHALNLGDAMSLYSRSEWEAMDESERISKGLPVNDIDLDTAGGYKKFKKSN